MLWIAIAAAQTSTDTEDPGAPPPEDAQPEASDDTPEEPEPPPERPWVEIPPVDTPLPGATRRIEDLEALASDPGALQALIDEAGFEEADFTYGSVVRGSWYVRPRFAVASLVRPGEGGSGARLGFSAGRRFWTLEALPVQIAADIGIRSTAAVGAGIGRRLEVLGSIGPWLGPARISLTAGGRWERERWIRRAYELEEAVFLLAGAGVSFDLDALQLTLGVLPAFDLTGRRTRATARDPALPVFGTETAWTAGLAVPLNPIGLAVDCTWRDTAIGGLLETGFSVQFTPRRSR